MRKLLLPFVSLLMLFIFSTKLHAQADPPDPCDDGSQETCQCETSPVLCTIDDLDGYEYSMTDFQHPQDGPEPLCISQPSVPNNPTWFSFVAWCEELELLVELDNCTEIQQGPFCPPFCTTTLGAQIAIYGNCNFTDEVACNVEDCGNEDDKSLVMTDLVIGRIYYFIIDGCAGSACDITINVIGTCGDPEIEDWTNPVDGPDLVCVGDPANYIVDQLDGANLYHWYVDGVEVGTSEDPNFDIDWDEEGTFELCVDASNDPCIPVTDDPDQICMTVEVYDPFIGDLIVDPNPLCPGEITNISVIDANDNPDLDLVIIVTDDNGIVEQVDLADATTFTYPECETFIAYAYQYIPSEVTLPSVGDFFSLPDCSSSCCEILEEEFSFEDEESPTFVNPPDNEAYECINVVPEIEDLEFEDNCIAGGFAVGVEDGAQDVCDGGTITRTWTVEDSCGNVAEHVQTITVDPLIEADWVDPPGNETVDCNSIPSSFPDLNYTNGSANPDCEISGAVSPDVVEDIVDCEGTITATWTFTDSCDRTIEHVQIFTVDPPAIPDWLDTPANETVSCSEAPDGSSPSLDYDNGQIDDCQIIGNEEAVVTGAADECGGSFTYEWTFTDECNRTITHIQEITVEPAPTPDWIDPPANENLTCNDLPLPTPPDLEYTNGETGDCEISGFVSPTVDGSVDLCGGSVTYTWDFTDLCGNSISHAQTITVDPVPEPDWIDPPANENLTCDALPLPPAPDLEYTNGESGDCEISGSVPAVESGSADECGGTITYNWDVSVECGTGLSYEQIIEIEPAPEAEFIDPPSNVLLNCDDLPLPPPPDLDYSNGESGVCEISGSVAPTVTGDVDICGGSVTYSWSFTDNCDREISHEQTIDVEPAPQADWIDAPAGITLDCDEAAEYDIPDLEYTNGETGDCEIQGFAEGDQIGTINPCGGTISYEWTFTDNCDRTITHSQTVNIIPAPEAEFTNIPGDIEVTCTQAVAITPPSISYDNGESGDCSISGTVAGTTSGTFTACGGNLVQNWNFTDACGRSISASRNVTVLPAPAPDWENPPGNITVSCAEVDDIDDVLTFSNNSAGTCLISGTVSGVILGAYDACGGNLTQEWSRTDNCGNVLSHTREITVTPAPEPDWIDPPADVTLDCGEDFPNPILLEYNNGEEGDCELSGEVLATVEIDGIEATYTWSFTNPCDGSELIHEQVVTQTLAPDITIDPVDGLICEGESFDLTQIIVNDANGTNFDVSYHTNTPATSGNEILNPENYAPGSSIVVYVRAFLGNDCADEAPFVLSVEDPPNAGDGGAGEVCDNSTNVSLNSFLSSPFDGGGSWSSPNSGEIDISNPNSVNFSGLDGGDYSFFYSVPGAQACPPDTAEVIITVLERPTVEILEVECTTGNDFYSVTISITDGAIFFVNAGDPIDLGGGEHIIENIPISSNLIIDAILASGFCPRSFNVNAPDCNCPSIPAPEAGPRVEICEGDSIPELSVTVDTSLYSVNWLDEPTGGIVLAEGTITYTPSVSDPGIYTFYTQTFDLVDSCLSNTTTQVELEIIALPTANEVDILRCGEGGVSSFDLDAYADSITGGVNNDLSFHLNESDAEMGENAIDLPFENTEQGTQQIFVRVENIQGCYSIVALNLIVVDFPSFDLEITAETCLLDSNGQLIVNPQLGSPPYTYDLGGNEQMDSVFQNLPSGNYELIVTDDNGCQTLDSLTINEGQEIDFEILSLECNDNGTSVDSTDDFYVIEILVTSVDGSTFSLTGDGIDLSGASYGTAVSFEVDAMEQDFEFTITDETTGCSITGIAPNLVHCSSDCLLDLDYLTLVCDDGGTPSDPGDDFYEVEFVINAINAGSNGTFIFRVDNVIEGSYTFGDTVRLSHPANGQTLDYSFTDSQITACFLNETVGPLDPCSDDCFLTANIIEIECDNEGTLNDESDDTFVATVVISGVNLGNSGWNGNDGSSGNYGDTVVFGPYLIVNGDPEIIISDGDDSDCTILLELPAPDPCSEPCELDVEFDQLACDNNGTGDDETDDFFGVEITVTTIEGPTTRYRVTDSEGNTYGPFDYGTPVVISPLPANGENITLTIVDDIATQCVAEITISQEPCSECNANLTMGPDQTLTCDISEVTISASAMGALNIQWTGPNNFSNSGDSVVVDASGVYIAIAEFEDNCFISDSLEVLVDDNIPTAVAGPDGLINCETDSFTLLNLSGNSSESVIVEWRDSDGNIVSNTDSFVVFGPGEYELRLIDTASNCVSPVERVSVELNLNQPDAVIFADPDSLFDCTVRTITLSTDVEENVTYNWQGPEVNSTGPSVSVFRAGEVILIALDTMSLCSDTASINLEDFDDFPRIEITPPDSLNCRDSSVIVDASDSYFSSDILYEWIDQEGNVITSDTNRIEVTESGWYTFRSTDEANDCVNSDSVFVEGIFDLLNLEISGDINLPCGENEGSLEVIASGGITPSEIIWSTMEGEILTDPTEQTINFSGSGSYFVQAVHPLSFCISETEVMVELLGDLSIEGVSVDSIICFGDAGAIRVEGVGGTPPISINISGQSVDVGEWVTDLSPGTYTIEAVDANGCRAEQTVILDEGSVVNVSLDPVSANVESGETITVEASTNLSESQIANILWSPPTNLSCTDCFTTIITALSEEEYLVTITDVNGCTGQASFRLLIREPQINIYIPNIFTPNGDGINDGFTLFSDAGVTIDALMIFDRWGNKMYETRNIPPNDPEVGWDGRFRGQLVNNGVYVYSFSVTLPDGTKEIIHGDITVDQ